MYDETQEFTKKTRSTQDMYKGLILNKTKNAKIIQKNTSEHFQKNKSKNFLALRQSESQGKAQYRRNEQIENTVSLIQTHIDENKTFNKERQIEKSAEDQI